LTEALWHPTPAWRAQTRLTAFEAALARAGHQFEDYAALHRWSVQEPAEFWRTVWDFSGVIGDRGETVVADADKMPGARWFPEARLNFAENLLRRRDETDAIVFWGEDKVRRRLSFNQLHAEVARLVLALRAMGIRPGDRVAAYLPNMPEAIAAMLASAAIGAIFSSCSPDFGVRGVLDRFGQIEPKLLFVADGYYDSGKPIACAEKVRDMVAELPSIERVVVARYIDADLTGFPPNSCRWDDFIAGFPEARIEFARLPFDHPLYILYSSGTTGVPKCIVHGAGGTLLQHLKEHQLHSDIRRGDRVFYFTTCGWMMWNWLASALASEASVLLYDGSPLLKRSNILFDFAAAERMTHFGTSARFIAALAKLRLSPRRTHALDALRFVLSTGSPLSAENFDYVYREIKSDICLASIAGGTDIVSLFVGGNPNAPVWRGEIQCRCLGMQVEVFDDEGNSVRETKGELVCTAPFPVMPLGFWNDPGGVKYHAAYFERYPNVWRHGDYVELTEHDGIIIHGRSDAVLNPMGVRIGTAEIYRQVEQLDEIVESLVIGQNWKGDLRVVLFVRLRDGVALDQGLIRRIKAHIRANTTPRHVPEKIIAVSDIPRTKSGKIVELAVTHLVHGRPVKNLEALANPEALAQFEQLPELLT
jgi:acetoacetyl-CoA synthetase